MSSKQQQQLAANRVPSGFGRNQPRQQAQAQEASDGSGSDSGSTSGSESGGRVTSNAKQAVQSAGHNKKHRRSNSGSGSGSGSGSDEEEKRKVKIQKKPQDKSRKAARKAKISQASADDAKDAQLAGSSNKVPSRAPVASASKQRLDEQPAGAAKDAIVMVHQLQPFSETVAKDVTEYLIRVEGSVQDIHDKCDENGDLLLSLADGIRIERTVPSIDQKVQSLVKLTSAADLHSKAGKMRSNTSVTYDAKIVGAHNPFPCSLKFTIPTIVGSSKELAFSGNDEADKQSLTFTLEKGEKLSNHVIMANSNNFDKKNFGFFSAFPTFNAENLRDGVHPALATREGVERVFVPHSDARMHPVVTLAQMHLPTTLSAEEMEKSNGMIPPHLMASSVEFPDHCIMAKTVFDNYEKRCATGLKAGQPLSDIANPYCKVSLASKSLFSAAPAGNVGSKKRLDSASNAQSAARAAWLTNPELKVGRTSESKIESAKSTVYSAYARIQVRSVQTVNLADLDD